MDWQQLAALTIVGIAAFLLLRAAHRPWLLFVHQLPAKPTAVRVRTWRRHKGLLLNP